MRGTENSPASELATRMIDKVFFAVPRWFRENIVKPNQKESAWYHRQYRRVPTIDECYTHDHMCIFEADEQMARDRKVEANICMIIANRLKHCYAHYVDIRLGDGKRPLAPEDDPCLELRDEYLRTHLNFYIKYGDLKANASAESVLMKQKHRMIWERRNGPYLMSYQAKKRAAELEKEAAEGMK